MADLLTSIAIATLVVGIIAAIIAYLTLRRTPKLPKPASSPVSTTILTAPMNKGVTDLPSFQPGMARMGFDRR
ncbi:hypothetical protein [Sphingomonas pruni]|uniref:hypothetical protein n=1 Tax=Sphingomonas pruni TaxID=40683 RepID=UPI000A61E7CA|nr:hypothetical protein [Sphingomonas pruni]